MKKPIINKKNLQDTNVGLIFFAELLQELLFHHTMDSYKAPALNTVTRAYELQELADQAFINSSSSTKQLTAVIEELEWSIKNDPVLTGDSLNVAHELIKKIKRPEATPKELTELSSAMILHLRNYWNDLKDAIRSTVPEGKQKSIIRGLAATFTAQIELRGHSRRYAHYVTKNLFLQRLRSSTKITNISELLNEFLDKFDVDFSTWQIVYRASTEFEAFKPHCSSYRMRIEDSYASPHKGNRIDSFFGQSKNFPLFIIFENIRAKDCYSARKKADGFLEIFTGACKFHVHDLKLDINPTCIAIDQNNNYLLIEPSPNPMMCGNVSRVNENLESKLKDTTEILVGTHFTDISTKKFTNALQYHKAAMEAGTPENQLLDLWAALEGFLPQPTNTGNRIGHYIALLEPTLTLTHSEKIFRYLSESLISAGDDVKKFINDNATIDGEFLTKCVYLIAAEEMMPQRIALLSLKSMHPLLRFRIDQIWRSFNSRKSTLATLLEHKKKVSWHIQRIYTTRNIIVHSANSLPYLPTLVENLHAYVDLLIPSIAKLAIASRANLDIESAIRLLSTQEEYHLAKLRQKDELCTSKNYMDIIFGSQNPLSPFFRAK